MANVRIYTILTVCICLVSSQSNLLLNPSFDDVSGFTTNWLWYRTDAVASTDARSGNTSFHATQRDRSWSGLRQIVTGQLVLGKLYYIEGWMKALSAGGDDVPITVMMSVSHKLQRPDGTFHYKGQRIAERTVKPGDEWFKLSGEFFLEDYVDTQISLEYKIETYKRGASSSPYNDFIVDDLKLYELQDDPSWLTAAMQRIDNVRKSNLTLTVHGMLSSPGYTNAKLRIKQIDSEFGIGSHSDAFLLNHNEAYRNTFLKNFMWSTLEHDMSWKRTEYSQDRFTWEDAESGINLLRKNGIKIRGGSVHEAARDKSPEFVRNIIEPEEMYSLAMKRVDDLLNVCQYKCRHWDVVNKMGSSPNFLSDIYGSNQINIDLYQKARNADSAAKLYVNDKNLITDGGSNIQNVLYAIDTLREGGVTVDGIGAQANLGETPSASLILHRLQRLADAEAPIWLTAYAYSNSDAMARASTFEDVLHAALSDSNVEGIMLADFWSKHNEGGVDASFYNDDFTPNAAGQRLELLLERLNKLDTVSEFDITPGQEITLPNERLYNGVYELKVSRPSDDKVIWKKTVSLLKHQGNQKVNIWI